VRNEEHDKLVPSAFYEGNLMHSLLASLLGPMFAKEMVEIARRRRYFINRVLYGLVLLFTFFLVWDSFRGQFARDGSAPIHVMARMAENLFHAVSGVQYGAVFLFVPLFLCGVIASEREERTLDLLFTTRLTDREIVLGKLGSRVAAVGLLVLFTLPVMSLTMLFGGVDPPALWRISACTLLAVLYAGAHAIYFSTVTKSAMGALVRTYWWMAVWLIGVPMAIMIPVASRSPTIGAIQFWSSAIMFLDPLFAFVTSLDGASYNQAASYLSDWFFPLTFVLPGGWSLFLLWRAIRRLRLAPTPFARLLGRIPFLRALRQGQRERERARAGARQRRAGWLWYLYRIRNPLWLRARLTRVYDREGYIGRIQWLAWVAELFFIVLILWVAPRDLEHRGTGIGYIAPAWLSVAVLLTILAGTSLVGDRRRGFLDLVLMTPLTPREMIDGTLLSGWEHVRRIYWLPCVLGLFFAWTGSVTLLGVCCSITTATLFGALLTVHGTACSLTAKTLPGALVPTFLFPLLVNIGVVFLIPIFEHACGPVLWFLSAVFLIITWLWVRRRTSAAVVGCYFMAVHLGFACLATCWSVSIDPRGDPIAFINPAYMTIQPLDGPPATWFHGPGFALQWYKPLGCYWVCLMVNFIWARRWLIRNFERLVERTDKPARLPPEPDAPARSSLARRAHVESRTAV
jgi:ABC-type transport system involved in multi-copper enzyme maturation permease subunit